MRALIKTLILCSFSLAFFACGDINSIHEEYLNRGEEIYTGVIDSLKAYTGDEQVKFTWEINADPRITKTVIHWNNGVDSSVVEVNRTQGGVMLMEKILKLPEDSYIFKFVTKDDEGHKSLSVEKTVEIYGPNYTSTLRNREVGAITSQSDGSVKLSWGSIEDITLLHTIVTYTKYTDSSDPLISEVIVANNISESILPDIKVGDEITVSSVYLPENSLDTFKANATTYRIPAVEK